jgi:hypothetical protein
MGQILHPKSSKLLREHGHQNEVCIGSTSKDEHTSQKSEWINMHWYKQEAIGAPRES